MKYKILFTVIILFIHASIYGQKFEWAKAPQQGGQMGYSVDIDGSGNTYTTGYFQQTVDFDPGIGVFELVCATNIGAGQTDIFVLKLDPNGNFIWAKDLGNGIGYSIDVDDTGNSYIASDGIIIKLDNLGNQVWSQPIPSGMYGPKIALDGNNNLCISSTYNLIKMNSSGTTLWTKSIDGAGTSIAVDGLNNIIVSGHFSGTGDFDPSPTIYNLTSAGSDDIFVCKLDASGNFVMAKAIGGNDYDFSYSVAIDASNNIYTTGGFSGTADFDPSASNFSLNSSGAYDIYISKLDPNGNYMWAKSMVGGSQYDYAYSISIDNSNNVYSTGVFSGGVDFDPGINTVQLANNGIFISKLDVNGNYLWARSLPAIQGRCIKADVNGNVYSTGYFQDNVVHDFNPYSGTCNYYGSNSGITMYLVKFGPECSFTTNASHTNVSCYGGNDGSATILTSSNPQLYEYSWGNSSIYSNLIAGNYSCLIYDSIGCKSTQNYVITEPSSALVDTNSTQTNVLCAGQANGTIQVAPVGGTSPYSYNWGPGTVNGNGTPNANNLIVGTYDCTITDANGCTVYEQFSISEPPPPPAPAICMVTVDEQSINNIIYWNKTLYSDVDSFIIYRETTANNYEQIGAVPFDSLSMFIDTVRALYFPFTGDPNTGTYRYKLQLRDNCGTYGALSAYHNTIYANQTSGTFNWNQYEIEGEPTPIAALSAYELFRDDSNTGNWNIVSAVSGTQTTITDPNFASFPNARWRIETIWSISCEPLKTIINNSRSNIKQPNPSAGIDELNVSDIYISPNPTRDNVTVTMSSASASIEIIDAQGKLLRATQVVNGDKIDLSTYETGMYIFKITTENGTTIHRISKN